MSLETLLLLLQCLDGANFTVPALELDEVNNRVRCARQELTDAIAEEKKKVVELETEN